MNERSLKPIVKNKAVGVFLMVIAVFDFLLIAHRLSYYVYEYDPKFSPVDYGKYNILSFFTVQSNFFVYVYLLISALGIFGVERARKIAFSPTVGLLLTTYIIVTGLVYCCGIPLGFTPPFKWDSPGHSMSSFIQVYYHMIVPPLMIILWFFPFTNEKIEKKNLLYVGIYPLVYSLFSIVRGAFSDPTFYPYPFYNPQFIWEMFFKDKPINTPLAYIMIIPLLFVGIGLFVLIARFLIFINDKRRA
ncbi:MAG: Pr6Pr family membrane protein [Acutalibacteraceae bacterium]